MFMCMSNCLTEISLNLSVLKVTREGKVVQSDIPRQVIYGTMVLVRQSIVYDASRVLHELFVLQLGIVLFVDNLVLRMDMRPSLVMHRWYHMIFSLHSHQPEISQNSNPMQV